MFYNRYYLKLFYFIGHVINVQVYDNIIFVYLCNKKDNFFFLNKRTKKKAFIISASNSVILNDFIDLHER
jgi:hypothetical protein